MGECVSFSLQGKNYEALAKIEDGKVVLSRLLREDPKKFNVWEDVIWEYRANKGFQIDVDEEIYEALEM